MEHPPKVRQIPRGDDGTCHNRRPSFQALWSRHWCTSGVRLCFSSFSHFSSVCHYCFVPRSKMKVGLLCILDLMKIFSTSNVLLAHLCCFFNSVCSLAVLFAGSGFSSRLSTLAFFSLGSRRPSWLSIAPTSHRLQDAD